MIREASRGRHRQKQILRSAELEVEAEVAELRDVEKILRNPGLPAQLDGEKSTEEFQSVRGTRLVEIK